ncbi:MAG TPA: tetratricopeptide repeat protein [Longimicrobium sp.]|nr:tetratricopeptide repeat protein [Longimicrobium sp.]
MSEHDGPASTDPADEVEALAAEAASLGEQERWDEARSLLADALERFPDAAPLLCWAGLAAQRLDEDGEAYELFRRCLAQDPQDPFVLAAAGSGVAAYDDPAAESALRLAALTAPDFAFARAAYGAYLAREGLFADAVRELEAARDLEPGAPGARTELAIAYLLGGRGAQGIDELEEALSASGGDSWVRGLLGMALVDAGRGEEGAEQLHAAAEERPEDVEVQLLAALAMAAQGWEDQAWQALARAEDMAAGADRELLGEVEERLEAGADAAERFLREDIGPSLLRERLLQRA